jgi:hypothetical protein|tara:strand:- start:1090 stop:1530 length:441 start_codon:yes stop_codon:yes gene_type:complete
MNTAFFSDPLEAEIVKQIRLWSSDDLPLLPYARSAWENDKVAILFIHEDNYQTLYSCISQWDDNYDIAIIADLGTTKNAEAFHEYLDGLNRVISEGMFIDKDIGLRGFHPDDSERGPELTSLFKTPYAMILVQRLSTLQQAYRQAV